MESRQNTKYIQIYNILLLYYIIIHIDVSFFCDIHHKHSTAFYSLKYITSQVAEYMQTSFQSTLESLRNIISEHTSLKQITCKNT